MQRTRYADRCLDKIAEKQMYRQTNKKKDVQPKPQQEMCSQSNRDRLVHKAEKDKCADKPEERLRHKHREKCSSKLPCTDAQAK